MSMRERFEGLASAAARRPALTLGIVLALAVGGGLLALRLDLLANLKIYNVISKAHLVLAKVPSEDPYRRAAQPTQPDIIDGE